MVDGSADPRERVECKQTPRKPFPRDALAATDTTGVSPAKALASDSETISSFEFVADYLLLCLSLFCCSTMLPSFVSNLFWGAGEDRDDDRQCTVTEEKEGDWLVIDYDSSGRYFYCVLMHKM